MLKRNIVNAGLLILFLLYSCSTDPEPINYGKDQCDHCRMTIMDNRFGAELVTKKGKIHKFDAAECMVSYFRLGKVSTGDIEKYIVTDASEPAEFTDGTKAVYLISEKFPSPMGANLSAYGNKSAAESFQKQYGGEIKSWDELLGYLKVKP